MSEEKIHKEITMMEKRYGRYTEKELLGLILFEVRGIGFKLKIISDFLCKNKK